VASEDGDKMKESNVEDLFQIDMSSMGDLFRCSCPSSERTRRIEVKNQGIAESDVPLSKERDARSRKMSEKQSTSEDGFSITDDLVIKFQGKEVGPACNSSCHPHEPSNDINDTKPNHRRLDKKKRMIHPPSKIEWARSLRNRSQSMRMRSFRSRGNIESMLPLTQKDDSSWQNEPSKQDIALQVLGENVEVTLPV
jgi:hypothetical protein